MNPSLVNPAALEAARKHCSLRLDDPARAACLAMPLVLGAPAACPLSPFDAAWVVGAFLWEASQGIPALSDCEDTACERDGAVAQQFRWEARNVAFGPGERASAEARAASLLVGPVTDLILRLRLPRPDRLESAAWRRDPPRDHEWDCGVVAEWIFRA